MDVRKSVIKAEFILLGVTALFLCLLLGLFLHDRGEAALPAHLETERAAAPEDLHPSVPPPLDLNTATEEELTALPGIGPELARRIAAWREANGPFPTVEALAEVSGIGPAKLEALEGLVTAGIGAQAGEAPEERTTHENFSGG